MEIQKTEPDLIRDAEKGACEFLHRMLSPTILFVITKSVFLFKNKYVNEEGNVYYVSKDT